MKKYIDEMTLRSELETIQGQQDFEDADVSNARRRKNCQTPPNVGWDDMVRSNSKKMRVENKKCIIRLTESDLHRIIENTVRRIINKKGSL